MRAIGPQPCRSEPPTGHFDRFADAFDTLYPQFLEESRETKAGNLTAMQVKQSGHEKVITPNGDIVFRLVTGGKMTHSSVDLGDGRQNLSGRKGSFYIAPPDTTAEWRSEGEHDLLMVSVAKTRVFELLGNEGRSPSDDPLRALYGHDLFDTSLARSVERIWCEINRNGLGAALKVDGLFLTLLGRIADLIDAPEVLDGTRGIARLDEARLARVTEYIDAHFGGAISVQDLADVACLSQYHFSRAFAAATHATPHQFVMNRRIAESKVLLADAAIPLAEVAYICGFANQSHFTTIFKDSMGVPPGKYRREISS
ncbi:MAG: AraC family transcriptional regulator [Pseudomonadota bacterium]